MLNAKRHRAGITDATPRDVNILADELKRIADDLDRRRYVVNGVVQQEVELLLGEENAIPHGLGRAYEGYIITRKRGPGDVYEIESSVLDRALFLPLATTADVTIDLIVW